LPELSAKSLEEPERLVAKDSSSILSAICSIALIPSPKVFPCASPADMVADLYLLKWYIVGGVVSSDIVTTLSSEIIWLRTVPYKYIFQVGGIIPFISRNLSDHLVLLFLPLIKYPSLPLLQGQLKCL
jgi:hypothetical protein